MGSSVSLPGHIVNLLVSNLLSKGILFSAQVCLIAPARATHASKKRWITAARRGVSQREPTY
jgi:hypothetical protein